MGKVRGPQMRLGEVRTEDIGLDIKSRDDIPAPLPGLQHLYSGEGFHERLFALPGSTGSTWCPSWTGRSGVRSWRCGGFW